VDEFLARVSRSLLAARAVLLKDLRLVHTSTDHTHHIPGSKETASLKEEKNHSQPAAISTMSIYEEVELEDLDYDEEDCSYSYPCPCGDKFRITLEELHDGEDIAKCGSCSLRIMVIFEEADLPPLPPDDEDSEKEEATEDEELAAKLGAVTVSS